MNKKILLITTTTNDSELLMAWRSNPLVYKYLYLQEFPLIWEDHLSWFSKNLYNPDRRMYTVFYKSRRIGFTSIYNFFTGIPEVMLYIGETTLWNRGVGKQIITTLLDLSSQDLKHYKAVCARIMEGNTASQKLFESCGFKKIGISRPGERYYEKIYK